MKTKPEQAAHRSGNRWVGGVLAVLLTLASWPALAFDFDALMALLAQHRSGEVAFSEQRFVQGIDTPLVSSGVLSFDAPDRFVRRTLKPRPESMAVDGNKVTLSRAGRSRSFSLDAAPEMLGLVEAVRATLTGNGATIRRHFKAALIGDAEHWNLALEPLERGQVKRIRITGQRGELSQVEMELLGGDRSVMSIEPLRADKTAATAPTS
ncbi:MAG: LolA-related protein [Ideonella sp.]